MKKFLSISFWILLLYWKSFSNQFSTSLFELLLYGKSFSNQFSTSLTFTSLFWICCFWKVGWFLLAILLETLILYFNSFELSFPSWLLKVLFAVTHCFSLCSYQQISIVLLLFLCFFFADLWMWLYAYPPRRIWNVHIPWIRIPNGLCRGEKRVIM